MDDYGYFGKGATGYAHYTQSFNRNFGSGGGGGKRPSGGGGNSGCLSCFVFVFGIGGILTYLIR